MSVEELVTAQVEPVRGISVQRKNFRSIVKKRLQKRLEKMGLRKVDAQNVINKLNCKQII